MVMGKFREEAEAQFRAILGSPPEETTIGGSSLHKRK